MPIGSETAGVGLHGRIGRERVHDVNERPSGITVWLPGERGRSPESQLTRQSQDSFGQCQTFVSG